jgi:nitrite reductase/ring-hydroxylating ferredoxin subunit
MPYVKVAKTSDLNDNSARLVETGGKSIALICADGEYYALANTCTHVGGPLCEGPVTGGTITCPWHAAQFDVKSGKALAGPARADVACYAVRVEGGGIEIEI